MAEMPVEQEPPCECVCHPTEYKAAYARGKAAGLERAAVIAESTMEETMLSAPDEHGVCQEQHVRLPGNALIAAAIRQEGRDGE